MDTDVHFLFSAALWQTLIISGIFRMVFVKCTGTTKKALDKEHTGRGQALSTTDCLLWDGLLVQKNSVARDGEKIVLKRKQL